MNYLYFFQANRTVLGFGLLTALSTSFGQTFFISLFLVQFQEAFGIGNSEFGLVYGSATLLSALLLPWVGGRIDGADLRRYTAAAMGALAISAAVVGLAVNVWMLGAGLLGVRLLGQGLLGHISQTVMAREFGMQRGRALGVAGMGYPMGEALLPMVCAVLLRFVPWRGVWLLAALVAGVVLLPAALGLLAEAGGSGRGRGRGGMAPGAGLKRRELWRDRRLYLVLPSVLVLPFVLTGLFLYQTALAESKGWKLEWMAGAFAMFAVTRAVASLAIGPVIDRFSATRLLPVYLLPLAGGLAIAISASTPLAAAVYMVMAGVTAGASGSIASAVWAEMYGAANVGQVRSLVAGGAVFATAASPALMGWLFQSGIGIERMVLGAIWLIVVAGTASLPVAGMAGLERGEMAMAEDAG
jgi:MFS family permease